MLPEVPTFAEAGLLDFDKKSWFAIFAPSATPAPIVARLGAEIRLMLAAPAVRELLTRQGVEPFLSTPEQVTAMLRADTEELRRVITAANIRMD
jgi:tripartite-type tricarboxylate transporter receptor subunit TctC